MACELLATQLAACESGIGKLDSPIELLKIIAQLSCEIADAGGGGGGTPSLPLNSIQFNDAGTFGGSAELTFNDTTNVLQLIGSQNILQVVSNVTALTIAGHALSAANAQSMISGAGTWNTTGNPVALRLAITDTASGATSKFLEFLGGAGGATSLFSVRASDGRLTVANAGQFFPSVGANEVGISFYQSGVQISSTGVFSFGSGAGAFTPDTAISRNAAGIVEINNNTPGTFRDLWARHLRLATAFTVATLPVAGVAGRMAYVTDALTPTFLTIAVGGGAVITPVFDNGSTWVTV